MEKDAKIYVAGHRGLVGSAIVRRLERDGYENLVCKTRKELDLVSQEAVFDFFQKERPDYVFLSAARVGGIMANATYPAEFVYENLSIETNVIHSAWQSGVKKLLFLGSSCIYPKNCPQPMKEEYLLSGYLETTNEPYAIAKIAGINMCQAYNRQYKTRFISVMPTNLYGPNDNFDLKNSHVLPAFIRKFDEAGQKNEKEVEIWGTGTPRREFLHVDDLSDACMFLMDNYEDSSIINIGVGKDITIRELADLVAGIVGFSGNLRYDSSKPDGTLVKRLDTSKINGLGWYPKISLDEGIRHAWQWYRTNDTC